MKLTLLSALLTVIAIAHEHPTPEMPKAFAPLKNLVGTWEGMGKGPDGKETAVKVVYALTSGGTAITETLFPGQKHEMISVYHKVGDTIAMTHYCALGNAPRMKLKKTDEKSIFFEMQGKDGITSKNEPHMHSVKLTYADPNSLVQEWSHYEKGKAAEPAVFTFKRVASGEKQ